MTKRLNIITVREIYLVNGDEFLRVRDSVYKFSVEYKKMIDSLKHAIDSEGFGLEERVSKILADKKFTAHTNFPLGENLNVDVFAYSKNYNSIFVIECKGTSPNNYLVLWDETKRLIDEKPNTNLNFKNGIIPFRGLEVLIYENARLNYYLPDPVIENSVILFDKETDPKYMTFRYCYQGDFRTGKTPHKKLPRQDIKNNLYKGILQLLANLSKVQVKLAEKIIEPAFAPKWVLPVIVTNTKINVRTEQEQLAEVPWAIYDCSRITSAKENPLSIEYVFIVNVNNLQAFIERMVTNRN